MGNVEIRTCVKNKPVSHKRLRSCRENPMREGSAPFYSVCKFSLGNALDVMVIWGPIFWTIINHTHTHIHIHTHTLKALFRATATTSTALADTATTQTFYYAVQSTFYWNFIILYFNNFILLRPENLYVILARHNELHEDDILNVEKCRSKLFVIIVFDIIVQSLVKL